MKKVDITFPALGIGIAVYLFSQSEQAEASTSTPAHGHPGAGDAVAYIKKYFPLAKQTEKLYAVPALVTIAQAGIEGQWGSSNVAVNAKNHFGIKADPRWKGASFGAYRKYNSVEDSFTDHAKFLAVNPRYNNAFLTSDPKKFLRAVADAKYSENPDYYFIVSRVMDIADRVK